METICVTGWRLGQVAGAVKVPSRLAREAAAVAGEFFAKAVAEEFSGDLVDEVWSTSALPAFETWFPRDEVRALGFDVDQGGMNRMQILATAGIDKHVDDIHGNVLIWVLHNDGLSFSQGRVSHKTKPGEWFIFDDRLGHAVKETKASTAYVCVSVPLCSAKDGGLAK